MGGPPGNDTTPYVLRAYQRTLRFRIPPHGMHTQGSCILTMNMRAQGSTCKTCTACCRGFCSHSDLSLSQSLRESRTAGQHAGDLRRMLSQPVVLDGDLRAAGARLAALLGSGRRRGLVHVNRLLPLLPSTVRRHQQAGAERGIISLTALQPSRVL